MDRRRWESHYYGKKQGNFKQSFGKLGENASGIVSDAGNIEDLMNLHEQVKQYTSQIDLVFANAGYGRFAPIEYVDENHFDELFNMLVKGPFFTVQQVLPLMKKGSSVIFNTSVATEIAMHNFSIYSAAKSAVQSFIKTFAVELTDRGIRVNGVSPGHIKTNIFNNTGLVQNRLKVQLMTLFLPYLSKDRENLRNCQCSLASDEASYIHGAEIKVDAGISVIR
jgi:NAD(P)-dependent dehydrogenase (short-subunit alcohol dehydrogenase family)